jgi:quercetin dioxygenase-like cupin family protein
MEVYDMDVTTKPYVFVEDLTALAQPLAQGIYSRTLHRDDSVAITYFSFAPGEGLSEHTSTKPAIVQVLRGEATLTLGDDTIETNAGSLVYMTASLKHSVLAKTDVQLLLTLIKSSS